MVSDVLPSDEALVELVQAVDWHRSPGYVAPDCQQVGPHEYILVHEQPELFDLLYRRIRQDDAYRGEYNGKRIRYVNVGGYKYWAYRYVLNREALPVPGEVYACRGFVTFTGDRAAAEAKVPRVTARAPGSWHLIRCIFRAEFHVAPDVHSGDGYSQRQDLSSAGRHRRGQGSRGSGRRDH